jgi:uncharacterized membrane protein
MKREIVLSYVGLLGVCSSVSLSLSTLLFWVFSGFPKGSTVSLDSFVIAYLLIGVVGVIIGIISGFLIGRNWREFRRAFT